MAKTKSSSGKEASQPLLPAAAAKPAFEPARGLEDRAEAVAKSTKGQASVLADIQALAPELVASGSLDSPIFFSDTALTFSCAHGDHEAVEFLLGIGASAKAPTRYGQSALMQAVASLSPNNPSHAVEWARAQACMELVLAAGGDIHHRNQVGQQAINWAAWSLHKLDAARWLLAHGANPSAADSDGSGGLHDAAQFGCLETAKLFLDAGADVEAQAKSTGDSIPMDPLAIAIKFLPMHRNYALVALLADAKIFAQGKRAAEHELRQLVSSVTDTDTVTGASAALPARRRI